MRQWINLFESIDRDASMEDLEHFEENPDFPLVSINDIGPKLYHGTSILNAAIILEQNKLLGALDDEGEEYYGVSLTDQYIRAAGYALDKTYQLIHDFATNSYGNATGLTIHDDPDKGAVLEFSSQKILSDFEVRAVSWQGSRPEERVIGDITNLNKYLVKIHIEEQALNQWIERFKLVADKDNVNILSSLKSHIFK